jgi:hypothetical protein
VNARRGGTTNVRMTRLVSLLPFLMACSSAAPHFGGDSGAPPPEDAAVADAAAPDAAVPIPDGGDAGADAAADPFVPHPPAGATQCGAGVITSGSSQSACMEPSMVLDDVPLFDGGTESMPRSCGALDVGGGEWQVWCTATEAYLWAKLTPANNTNVMQDCHGLSLLMIDEGLYESGNGGGNGAQVMTYESDGTEIAGTVPGDPQTVIASITLSGSQQSGSAQLFVAGSLEDSCQGGAFGPPTVLAGVDLAWKQ